MTDFHEIQFPASISFKTEGGPTFRTEIANLKSGKEKRNIVWSKAHAEYEISYKDISKNEANSVLSFFMARNGRAYGFRFKDWNDFEGIAEVIGTGDGTKTEFQIIKNYGDAENTYNRKIDKIVSGTCKIYLDDILQTDGYSLDENSGLITFDVAPANDLEVKADFQFDVPVRFAEDSINARNESYLKSSIKSVKLIEVKI